MVILSHHLHHPLGTKTKRVEWAARPAHVTHQHSGNAAFHLVFSLSASKKKKANVGSLTCNSLDRTTLLMSIGLGLKPFAWRCSKQVHLQWETHMTSASAALDPVMGSICFTWEVWEIFLIFSFSLCRDMLSPSLARSMLQPIASRLFRDSLIGHL